jgi:hypothetical protein
MMRHLIQLTVKRFRQNSILDLWDLNYTLVGLPVPGF